jgi:hypothetical protein
MNKLGMRLKERLNRSAFFFGAVLFHLVIFLMILGYVVFPSPPPPDKETGFEPTPALPKQPVHVDTVVVSPAPPVNPGGPIVLVNPNGGQGFQPSHLNSDDFGKNSSLDPGKQIGTQPGPPTPPTPLQTQDSPLDIPGVAQTIKGWHPSGNSNKFVLPIYLAKYADGDWDCNAYLHDGKLVSGCLPNLMAKIKEWSNGEIEGRDLKVVALDSPQILTDPPPFIFFTGHKDFHLTELEVANLKKYLKVGGCLWGDSAFAGDGSRFDVAFHREMKRVLPDLDIQFQSLPTDHDIFIKSKFQIDSMPQGMNRRADPIEYMNLGGQMAVIYTPNDYSDMMTMLLLPGRNEREAQMDGWNHWEPQHPLFTPGEFTWHAATYFRNYDPPAVMSTYKLSMNILIHLLHRYDDALLLTP